MKNVYLFNVIEVETSFEVFVQKERKPWLHVEICIEIVSCFHREKCIHLPFLFVLINDTFSDSDVAIDFIE